jgi:hypothetical protein
MIGERLSSFPAYVIVRIASPDNSWGVVPPQFAPVGVSVEVESVVLRQTDAESEVERLNRLHADQGASYRWRHTRIVLPEN